MGQIFDRLKNISSSYINESKFVDSSIFDDEDEELKRIIDNLDKKKSNSTNNAGSNSSTNSKQETFTSSSKGIYDTLVVKSNSTKEETYAAYKNLLKQYHPDKVATLGKEIQEIAISKTKEINSAFQQIKKERQW